MASYVKGYNRHVNGKLITVRAYEQSDGGSSSFWSTEAAIMAGVHDRPPMVGKPGIFTHGLVPIALFPSSRDLPFAPTQLWIRKDSNMQGLGGIGLSDTYNLDQALVSLSSIAETKWKAAVEEGLDHIKLVLINNPGRDITEILSRPDILDALKQAGLAGADSLTKTLTEIWIKNGGLSDSSYLDSVLQDVTKNGLSFAPRMTTALLTTERSEVEKVLLKDRVRALAAQSVIETRAKMEAKIRVYELVGVTHVKWLANKVNNTPCSACLALHGSVVKIGDEFDATAGNLNTPVYFDLTCPPRHPNCKCTLSPIKV